MQEVGEVKVKPLILLALSAALAAPAATGAPRKPHPDLPREFEQQQPRGQIASVDEPQFVAAADADVPDDAWMLGVVIDGHVKAYSLNLLNRHEIVNDRYGDRPVAAVW